MEGDQGKKQVKTEGESEDKTDGAAPDGPITSPPAQSESHEKRDVGSKCSVKEPEPSKCNVKESAAAVEKEEVDEGPETGVRVQVPDGILPALVDEDGLSELARAAPPPRPRIMLWRHLNCQDVRQIRRSTTLSEVTDIVGLRVPEVLNCTPTMTSFILLELLLYVLQYARKDDLNEEQTSVVFSVAKATHDYATSTCFGNVADTFSYFRDLMAAHCVNRPPWSLDLFEPERAERFARYFADMYFRHFSLVKAAFTPYVTLDIDIWYEPKIWLPPEEKRQAPPEPAADVVEAAAVARPGTPGLGPGSK